ncbi:phosphoethanolamine transferase [Mesosutterella sp. OilRF-GAM-744-9]|uniref:Phosphoethanolamine transferase n=1 Tax=Mesosutterella porci TaxID=2915351 RepID=A0ABS9MSY8_9BURK|nr:phosphoethanolamine transferase [Mesosutterella sp. oilRF-744-WT-GAM-9]MCG5031652.1 phosphoethanolamine transferase [Mesosutterella sp. oilRF-744-WT-GAM-9]
MLIFSRLSPGPFSRRNIWRWGFALILTSAFNLVLPAAMGYSHSGDMPWKSLDPVNFLVPVLALLILSQHWLTRRLIAIPAVAAAALYFPAGMLYGRPNILISVALLQTNPAEAAEFASNTPPWLFLGTAGMLVLGLAAIRVCRNLQLRAAPVCCCAIALAAAVWIQTYGRGRDLDSIQAVGFAKDLAVSAWSGAQELRDEASAPEPSWADVTAKPRFQDYVLVIGESQRRDYASVYGYPLDTTPFLRKSPGIFFSHFVAPGGNTGISLPRLLSLNKPGTDSFNSANNVLTLANSAGFNTWWLSNQGRGGAYDNPIAQIGVRAKHTIWLKGNYADPNVDDFELLPKLREALDTPADGPRLFVLHLMGSHPTFCTRLSGRAVEWDVGDPSMSCYLTTYRMMDEMIEKIVRMLGSRGRTWSLLYFADHGLSMQPKPGTETGKELEHGYDARQNYDVPLFSISSTSTTHEVNPAARSGFRMLQGLAQWLGISTSTFPADSEADFWGRKDDSRVRVFGNHDYSKLKDDPPVIYELKK